MILREEGKCMIVNRERTGNLEMKAGRSIVGIFSKILSSSRTLRSDGKEIIEGLKTSFKIVKLTIVSHLHPAFGNWPLDLYSSQRQPQFIN